MLARVATTVRTLALVGVTALVLGAVAASTVAAASPVSSRYQLRGHLPELGDSPRVRVFATQATYDTFRGSLGEANVFPPASSLFMSFDKEILALYSRGNDSGGRCLATALTSTLDGDTVRMDLGWQSGTCGAPANAHYPFLLVALSRTAADGTSWVTPARPVCATAPGLSESACSTVGGTATAAPTAPPSPTASPAPTATSSPSPAPTATRTLTPSVPAVTSPVAVASPSPAGTVAPTVAATRSPAAAASPAQVAGADTASNYLLYGMLIAIGFLVGIALMLSRGGSRRR